MDYKEKYEIGLEGIQEILGSGEDSIKMSRLKLRLQGIFPELKESDDERIRKSIIRVIKGNMPDNDYRKEYLAWLEKQSEPIDKEKILIGARKHVALSIMNFLDRCTLGMCLSNMECKDLEDAVVDSDWSKVYDYMKKKLEKQGEQKPTIEMKSAEESLYVDSDTYNKIVDECIYGEQETAWSEVDETIKNNIIHIIRQYDKISKRENQPCWYVGDCLLWVQNIKDRVIPQPKQECSDEDERIRHETIELLETANHPNVLHRNGKALDFTENINWLKSLCLHKQWKPSDGQLKALKEACDEHWEPDGLDPLYTLYQDLKKLMEE